MKNNKEIEDLFNELTKTFGSRVNIVWYTKDGRQKIGFDLMPGVAIEDALIEVANGMKQFADGTAEEIDLAEEEKNMPHWTFEEFDAFLEFKKENPGFFEVDGSIDMSGNPVLDNVKINEFLEELREGKK